MDGVKERTPADFARFSDTELMNVIHGAMIAYGVAMEDAGEMMRKVESVVRELAIPRQADDGRQAVGAI